MWIDDRKRDKSMQLPSDDGKTTLHALFPTLVYQTHVAESQVWRERLEEVSPEFHPASEAESGSRHFAGEYHGQILLHQQERLRPVFLGLAREVERYLNVLGMRPHLFDMQCLKSWFVICDASGDEPDAMMAHNHSCSDISWVYYVDVPDDTPIRFHAPGPQPTAPFGSAFHYDWQNEAKSAVNRQTWWNRDSATIQPRDGDLLIFPGHQLHSIDANRSGRPRISVAGDIALTLKPEFKDLEFGRVAREHWLTIELGQPNDQAD